MYTIRCFLISAIPVLLCITLSNAQSDHYAISNIKSADSNHIKETLSIAAKLTAANPDSAVQVLLQAIAQSRLISFEKGAMEGYTRVGYLYNRLGRYDQAITCFGEALKLSRSSSDKANIYNGIAGTYNFLNNTDKSIYYYIEAIRNVQKTEQKGYLHINIYHNLSTLLMQSGRYEKAEKYIDEAFGYLDAMGKNQKITAKLLNVKGVCVFSISHDLPKSLRYIDSAIAISEREHIVETLHPALVNKGTLLVESGMAALAIPVFIRAKEMILNNDVNLNDKVGTISALGNAYLKINKFKEAETELRYAWQFAAFLPKEKLFLARQLAALYAEMQDYKLSNFYKDIYIGLSDSVYQVNLAQKIEEMETRFRTLEKDKNIAKQNEKLLLQQEQLTQKNFWILAISFGSILGLGSLGVVILRNRQKVVLKERNKEIDRLQAIIEGEESERQRLAQELHDGIKSQLTGVKAYLLSLGNIFPEIVTADAYENTRQTLDTAAADLIKITHNLLPNELHKYGLVEALKIFINTMARGTDIKFEFEAYGHFGAVAPTVNLYLYRIIQELMHNIIKHSRATDAVILLNKSESVILLNVEDNGIGFDVLSHKNDGIGLLSIQHRTKALKGEMIIESTASTGTVFTITIPLNNQESVDLNAK
jgi:two-component system NarL family sensor kinase